MTALVSEAHQRTPGTQGAQPLLGPRAKLQARRKRKEE